MRSLAALILFSYVFRSQAAAFSPLTPQTVFDPPLSAKANGSACRLPGVARVNLGMGFNNREKCATSVGTLNAFMFFVDFPDAGANDTTQGLYDFFVPKATEWYTNSSYGKLKLNVTADMSRFYRMPATTTSYNWTRALTGQQHLAYIQDAMEVYLRDSGKALTSSDVLYIVPTVNASAISFSPTYTAEIRQRSGQRVAKAAVTFGADAYLRWKYKVLNHETGHTMCLPDLYPYTGGATGLWVGGWDMMGYINGPSPDYLAWSKWILGWLSDSQVDCITATGSSTHTVFNIEDTGDPDATKAVVVKHNSTSALVAEVRSAQGVDSASCATGVLLYTVSTIVNSGYGPIRIIDTKPRSGGCASEKLNDATLHVGESWNVTEWGVMVNVTGQSKTSYTFTVVVV